MKENKQIRRNLAFNIINLASNVLIGLFYTPYLVKSLGVVAYGVVPLALIINQYISVVTGSLTSALTRFYSIALQKDNKEEASMYLSTSIVVVLALILILIGPLWYVINNVDNIFTIPPELVRSAKLLFTYTVISFFLSLLSSVFNITLYAFNRLDYLNIIKIIRSAGKFVFAIMLFVFLDVNIAYVGMANMITEIILLIFSIIVFINFSAGKVNLSLNNFSKTALTTVSVMASWTIIHQLGDTGLYRIDNILVNIFWSSKESGILGAFTELGNYTMIIASVIGSLFGPLILIAYSKNNHEEVKKLTLDRSLSVGVMVAVMAGALAGFSPIILRVWVGDEFIPYTSWLILKLSLIPFYSAAGVFAFANRAWNKVKFPAVMTVILGVVNFIILYSIAKLSNGSINVVNYMLFIAAVLGIAQSYFLNGLYFSKIYSNTRATVIKNSLKILITFISIYALSYLINALIDNYSNIVSLSIILLSGIMLMFVSLKVLLNKEQFDAIIDLFYQRKKK